MVPSASKEIPSTPEKLPIVEINRLVKTYPGAERPAVDGIDLRIPSGEIFGLLGPNGAGKTTLLSVVCGLMPATAGTLRINSSSTVGLAPQDLALYPSLTARENLSYFGGMLGLHGARLRQRMTYCLDVAELNELADRRVETFSGGLKRRLNLVIALLHEPELLILDEPTVGIDSHSRRFIHERLRQLNAGGVSIIYTSHYMDEAEQLCDEIAIIDHGHIVAQGSTDELLAFPHVAHIELRLGASPSPVVQDAIRSLPHVDTVKFQEKRVLLMSKEPHLAVEAVMGLLREHGAMVSSLSFGLASLEDVFLALTGNPLRD